MDTALALDGLRKAYGSTVAVDDLSLEVETGEIFGLIGPNGAGKTTAVECALGLRKPDEGTVRVLGMDPQQAARDPFYRRVGAQLQAAALPDRITVREALDLFASFYPETTDRAALLDRWGLADKRNASFGALSGGQKQRLFVALALVHDPDLVILDEISTGLDPEARRGTRDLLRAVQASGTTVILVTHFMDEAQALCDRVAMVHRGRCVALDTPEALVDRLDASYRVRFTAPADFDPTPLRAVNGVQAVTVDADHVQVQGGDDLLTTVVHNLSEQGVTPDDLHAERATLEDVFLTLTDDSQDPASSPHITNTEPQSSKAPS
ncbi:ABC transporter ATP-binding protein [Salinibacter ruber]|uniref:ABC transporter ATP-binding protein n=1 Tax=Salinibacter ruber TaxID=146919 RepID=UPI0020734345|nr:ABC transporter ATP-binding protein [Salinibacter ruber]MCS3702437.1 ABC-2 type transport system ATP-binding protein [Salinibacter ruber]